MQEARLSGELSPGSSIQSEWTLLDFKCTILRKCLSGLLAAGDNLAMHKKRGGVRQGNIETISFNSQAMFPKITNIILNCFEHGHLFLHLSIEKMQFQFKDGLLEFSER